MIAARIARGTKRLPHTTPAPRSAFALHAGFHYSAANVFVSPLSTAPSSLDLRLEQGRPLHSAFRTDGACLRQATGVALRDLPIRWARMKNSGENPVSISVVVPFFNAMPFLEACAESLRRQLQVFPDAEVIFADAGSTDGSGAFLTSRFPEFHLVRLQGRNAYVARNRAAESARGSILAFTDADCVVEPERLRSILSAVQSGADLVTGPVDASMSVSSPLRGVHVYENKRMEEMCRAGGESINYAYTNNLAIRAELFRSLGGFDEAWRRGGDSELALRALARASTTMTFAPGMNVVHLEITSLRQWWFKKYLYGRSRTSNRSSPSANAYRSSRSIGGDVATMATLGVGRFFFEVGRIVGMALRR